MTRSLWEGQFLWLYCLSLGFLSPALVLFDFTFIPLEAEMDLVGFFPFLGYLVSTVFLEIISQIYQ